MLPHLKTYTFQEKENARKAFEEGSKIRKAAMNNQKKVSILEIEESFKTKNKK